VTLNPLYCQKYKYKDIFPELDKKNYASGESKLRSFLAETKNKEHPNANFQMAMMLEAKIKPLHVVNDSTKYIRYCDSIRTFYANAKKFITEKEIKKRDEYYQAYHRRDLRTGDFTIKKSDIDGDIEKKLKYYTDVKIGAKFLAVKLPYLNSAMGMNKDLYTKLTKGFDQMTSFALSVDESIRTELQKLSDQNLKTKEIVSGIQDKVASLPEIGFNSNEVLTEIKQIDKDGLELKDVYEGSFKIWDYASFTTDILTLADGEISEYKAELLTESQKFDKMLKQIAKAEVPAESPQVSESLLNKAAEIDPENLVLSILKFKSEEVKYRLIDAKELEDQTHIFDQLERYDSLNNVVKEAQKHFEDLASLNTELERKKYDEFIKVVFNRQTQLEQYISDKKVWVNNRAYFIGKQTEEFLEASRWGTNPSDSVALFLEEEKQLSGKITTYLESDTLHYHTVAGFEISETPFKVFVGRVDPGMNLIWKYNLTSKLQVVDSIATNAIFKEVPGWKDYLTVFYTEDQSEYQFMAFDKQSGDIEWKAKIKPKKPIFDVKYNDLTKETVLYLDDPEILEQGGEVAYLVIDKSGKVRK